VVRRQAGLPIAVETTLRKDPVRPVGLPCSLTLAEGPNTFPVFFSQSAHLEIPNDSAYTPEFAAVAHEVWSRTELDLAQNQCSHWWAAVTHAYLSGPQCPPLRAVGLPKSREWE